MVIISPIWHYYNSNLRYNVEASAVTFVVGYFAGLRRHFKKIHQHLDKQDIRTGQIHKHLGIENERS